MLHIPIIRQGRPYRSIDIARVPHFRTRQTFVEISQANAGLIRREMRDQETGRRALEGLTIETLLASLPYLLYLLYLGNKGTGQLGHGVGLTVLLISAGAITAIPLLLFNGSTTRLPLSTIGLMQFITPTIQFSIGVWIFNEYMPTVRWVGFLIIWLALVTLAVDLVKSSRTVDNSLT